MKSNIGDLLIYFHQFENEYIYIYNYIWRKELYRRRIHDKSIFQKIDIVVRFRISFLNHE